MNFKNVVSKITREEEHIELPEQENEFDVQKGIDYISNNEDIIEINNNIEKCCTEMNNIDAGINELIVQANNVNEKLDNSEVVTTNDVVIAQEQFACTILKLGHDYKKLNITRITTEDISSSTPANALVLTRETIKDVVRQAIEMLKQLFKRVKAWIKEMMAKFIYACNSISELAQELKKNLVKVTGATALNQKSIQNKDFDKIKNDPLLKSIINKLNVWIWIDKGHINFDRLLNPAIDHTGVYNLNAIVECSKMDEILMNIEVVSPAHDSRSEYKYDNFLNKYMLEMKDKGSKIIITSKVNSIIKYITVNNDGAKYRKENFPNKYEIHSTKDLSDLFSDFFRPNNFNIVLNNLIELKKYSRKYFAQIDKWREILNNKANTFEKNANEVPDDELLKIASVIRILGTNAVADSILEYLTTHKAVLHAATLWYKLILPDNK